MEVFGAENIGKIEMGKRKVIHGAGIGEDVALLALGQDGRQTSGLAGEFSDLRDVHAALPKALEADLAERVTANAGAEAHAIAEAGQRSEERRVGKEWRSRWKP